MKQSTKLKIQIEALSLIITLIAMYAITYPIRNSFQNWEFLYPNALFIFIFITYSRYLFLLKFTFLSHQQVLKVILIFASVPLVFHLVELISNFQNFLDNRGLESFNAYFDPSISDKQKENVTNYLSREFIFFGVGSVIVAILMPFRMLISFWRVYNKKGTV